MFARKILAAAVLAGLSAGVLAQQSDTSGRPYSVEVYYESDPFAPLPQIEKIRSEERAAQAMSATAANTTTTTDFLGRPRVNETANEVYFSADPFDPLPGLQAMYRAQIPSAEAPSALAGGKTDLFGRPDSGFSALEAYRESDPFGPIPQLWGHDVEGVGAVASKTHPANKG